MKAWKVSKGIVEIGKGEWDKLFRHCHPIPNREDYRKLSDNIKSKMQSLICPDCGGVGVTDYDFDHNKWIIACRECRRKLD